MNALVGDGTVLTIAAVLAAAIIGGHWLGGHTLEHRAAVAQAAATRHPGIAALLVHRNFDDHRVSMAIVLFLLTSIIMSSLYAKWEERAAKAAHAG